MNVEDEVLDALRVFGPSFLILEGSPFIKKRGCRFFCTRAVTSVCKKWMLVVKVPGPFFDEEGGRPWGADKESVKWIVPEVQVAARSGDIGGTVLVGIWLDPFERSTMPMKVVSLYCKGGFLMNSRFVDAPAGLSASIKVMRTTYNVGPLEEAEARREWLRERVLPDLISYVRSIARTHVGGVVLCDVKPDNAFVLLGVDGERWTLPSGGMSGCQPACIREASSPLQPFTVAGLPDRYSGGTYSYLTSEGRVIHVALDVYALGMTIAEIISAMPGFEVGECGGDHQWDP
uniref:Protein kinase domain-containing protein n=1 Tax=Chromera velia CCMP2878 TaxID=1169474 RepID=A0A0G4IFP8_9ALVE|eukprot:Cvel_13964.t1-p1 / transcript=Cvel_13964.t1 / gene=Cvel_13964 / organism=Chromera_velia_CCMP2878 / gene_product=hypothetical protein / transcript_product=hypothetical protein / location=Cvel_scaffold975:49850-50713(-) / protein_length=288 / sequence_SO=supercontig / SO=protein_coding / is_pseudo=false